MKDDSTPAPATSETTENRDGFPLPIASFATLSQQEVVVVADLLRWRSRKLANGSTQVRILPNLFEVCAATGDDISLLQGALQPLFQQPENLSVVGQCKSLANISVDGLDGKALRGQLINKGQIDLPAVVAALENAFQKACGQEILTSTRSISKDGLTRAFASPAHLVPPSAEYPALTIKEQVRVTVQDAAAVANTSTRPGERVAVVIADEIFWKTGGASSKKWVQVETLKQLDPDWIDSSTVSSATNALDQCAKGLLNAMLL